MRHLIAVLERQIDVLRKINEFARFPDDTQLAPPPVQVTARASLPAPSDGRGHRGSPSLHPPQAAPAPTHQGGAGSVRQPVEEQQKLAAIAENQGQG